MKLKNYIYENKSIKFQEKKKVIVCMCDSVSLSVCEPKTTKKNEIEINNFVHSKFKEIIPLT